VRAEPSRAAERPSRLPSRLGLDPKEWTLGAVRHSFLSLLSSSGLPPEDISHLVGHSNTSVTEKVDRKELRAVLSRGAKAMDALFTRPALRVESVKFRYLLDLLRVVVVGGFRV